MWFLWSMTSAWQTCSRNRKAASLISFTVRRNSVSKMEKKWSTLHAPKKLFSFFSESGIRIPFARAKRVAPVSIKIPWIHWKTKVQIQSEIYSHRVRSVCFKMSMRFANIRWIEQLSLLPFKLLLEAFSFSRSDSITVKKLTMKCNSGVMRTNIFLWCTIDTW